MPYRLATPQCLVLPSQGGKRRQSRGPPQGGCALRESAGIKWGGWRGSNPRVPEPQSGALTASPHPPCTKHMVSKAPTLVKHIFPRVQIDFLRAKGSRLPAPQNSAQAYGNYILHKTPVFPLFFLFYFSYYLFPRAPGAGGRYKKASEQSGLCSDVEAPPRFELGVKDLQSSALPLGHGAIAIAK